MDEQDREFMRLSIETAVLKAKAEIHEQTIRMLHNLHVMLFGTYGKLIIMLEQGKVDAVIHILSESRKVSENIIANMR